MMPIEQLTDWKWLLGEYLNELECSKDSSFFTRMKYQISNLLISTKISWHNNSDLKVCSLPLGQRAKWACIQWSVAEMQQGEPSLQYSQEAKWPLDLSLELWIWCRWDYVIQLELSHHQVSQLWQKCVNVALSAIRNSCYPVFSHYIVRIINRLCTLNTILVSEQLELGFHFLHIS